ncbi:MAG TPA: lysylphosphatidylglycerol synthase transmembrane domain-containing protein [Vicinamibacterales bacterium]|nr:lysylphosphatidylglycerol synthase transmembrane domain-containing protein [Vicinamibacterales bacterium]
MIQAAVGSFLRGVADALTHARLSLVGAALMLHAIGLVITGERWRVVIAALGTRLALSRTILINLAGIFVRNATPTTGLGGDASRVALMRADGVPLAQGAASFVWVRLAEVPPIAVLVALSAPIAIDVIGRSHRAAATAAAAVVLAVALGWLNRKKLRTRLAELWERSRSVRIGGRAMGLAIFYATLAQVETIARQIVVAAAFGLPLSIPQAATVTAMGIAGGLVPTVGSIGAIDGSLVAGLMLCGASAQTAIAITVVERAISYGITTTAGAAALAWLGGSGVLRAVRDRAEDPVTG